MMRDFYWKRKGWRWVVATVEREGEDWVNETVLFTTWLESTASKLCLIVFEAYLEGRNVQRIVAMTNGECDGQR